jgi:hypothetical protein
MAEPMTPGRARQILVSVFATLPEPQKANSETAHFVLLKHERETVLADIRAAVEKAESEQT